MMWVKFVTILFFIWTVGGKTVEMSADRPFEFPRTYVNLTKEEYQKMRGRAENFEQNARSVSNATEFKATKCGVSNKSNQSRIIGGTEAKQNEFPWQAWLVISLGNGRYYSCGGSLISNQWILTAAHCVDLSPPEILVFLGGHYSIQNVNDTNRKLYLSNTSYYHPSWNSYNATANVALVKLPAPISYNDYTRPICLASANDPSHVGEFVVASGWGRTTDCSNNNSPVLRKVTLTVISKSACSYYYDGYIIPEEIICTSGSGGVGTCNGDNGGPLSIVDKNGIYTQIGITSFGSRDGCEIGNPSGFTRVRSYLDWISTTSSAVSFSSAASLLTSAIVLVANRWL